MSNPHSGKVTNAGQKLPQRALLAAAEEFESTLALRLRCRHTVANWLQGVVVLIQLLELFSNGPVEESDEPANCSFTMRQAVTRVLQYLKHLSRKSLVPILGETSRGELQVTEKPALLPVCFGVTASAAACPF